MTKNVTKKFDHAAMRAKREKAKVDLVVLAEILGVSRITLWRWETGVTKPGRPQQMAWRMLLEELISQGIQDRSDIVGGPAARRAP